MTPSLARRGKLVLASGVWFVVVGALYSAPPLVALGGLVVCAVMTTYLWFFPTAILLRRRKIELSWWVPPGEQSGGTLTVDRPFALHVALRNHGARQLRVLGIKILGSSALEVPQHLEAAVPAGKQVELLSETRSHQAGHQVMHGAVLVFGDKLGLFEVRAYFPNPIAIKVFPPRLDARIKAAMPPLGLAQSERVGLNFVRRRGLSGDLREIREHAHGDPFKFIAWKPTARRQKLMVRELETEIVVTQQILVDMAGSMRRGVPGKSKLDYVIQMASGLAKSALDNGDRVGLVTFDTRVYSSLKPSDGYHHYLKLVDQLIETNNVVDEDLTDVTNGELAAAVAKYLAHQEAVDVRVRRPPPLDDPAWERIQAGPDGELYDLGITDSVVKTLLKSMSSRKHGRAAAPLAHRLIAHRGDARTARMRLFCRIRGIELPYLANHEPGMRVAGLVKAMEQATRNQRVDTIIVFSDLMGLADRPNEGLRALSRARQNGRRLIIVAPFEPSFGPGTLTPQGGDVADILLTEQLDQLRAAKRLASSRGIPVLQVGPRDTVPVLAARIASARGGRRSAA